MLLPADSERAQIYIGAEGGWTGLPDGLTTSSDVTSVKARFNGGFNAGVRGGYEWGPWRFEEEYSYRQNNVPGSFRCADFTIRGISGNRHTNSIMTNVLYDFTVGQPITPHFGFGIGAVEVFDGLKVPGIGQFFNNSSWQFGYQGIAGIRYNLSPSFHPRSRLPLFRHDPADVQHSEDETALSHRLRHEQLCRQPGLSIRAAAAPGAGSGRSAGATPAGSSGLPGVLRLGSRRNHPRWHGRRASRRRTPIRRAARFASR